MVGALQEIMCVVSTCHKHSGRTHHYLFYLIFLLYSTLFLSFPKILFEAKWRHRPGSKISNAQENNVFATSFIRFRLRRKFKGVYVEVGERKVGLGRQGS